MQTDQLQQLSAWLAATDIAELELRGPDGQHLRLRHDGASVEAIEDETTRTAATRAAVAPTLIACAGSVGVFLHAHPLHDKPLVQPGSRVRAGQALGLLRIGALLLPVCTAKDAVVLGALASDGATVGFGTPLVELQPLDEAS